MFISTHTHFMISIGNGYDLKCCRYEIKLRNKYDSFESTSAREV